MSKGVHPVSFRAIAVLVVLFLLCSSARAAEIPVSGKGDPRFAAFDAACLNFMREHDISAGSVAIRMNNQLVYERAFAAEGL